ncbi:LysR family transcriptional regulator [Streptomyces sp. NRRL S-1813]|uniref:LysR family transcriptional regulator n=1 Tax=Streptomyces sp. NRRL S-1813 TaxID=1463888 RepID=UPI0004CA0B6F|nr:LysR family transcriptional regulator [Streptomyces sp. NRRL S-1813]
MDPHLLRTFVAVAGHGSFSEAARELGYTQSAVSQHIAALEKDLGAVLLQRRPVAPTGAGIRLLEHARPLLLRWDAARADMARLTTAPTTREAPDTAIPLAQLRTASGSDGYHASLRYEGTDVRGLTALIAAGHGLALLPQREFDDLPGIHAVPLRTPRLVHRIEALHNEMPDGPTARLAAALVAAS